MAVFCENCGRVGYSPVANTPEFRQLAEDINRKAIKNQKKNMIFICIFCVSLATCFWAFTGEPVLNWIITAFCVAVALPISLASKKNINRLKTPPVEVTVLKHEETMSPVDYHGITGGEKGYAVRFKYASGKTFFIGAYDKRYQLYYQIGDRCLYHRNVVFVEKYDKSRDTFSLCSFCKEIVELGKTRCTHCDKPMLV